MAEETPGSATSEVSPAGDAAPCFEQRRRAPPDRYSRVSHRAGRRRSHRKRANVAHVLQRAFVTSFAGLVTAVITLALYLFNAAAVAPRERMISLLRLSSDFF